MSEPVAGATPPAWSNAPTNFAFVKSKPNQTISVDDNDAAPVTVNDTDNGSSSSSSNSANVYNNTYRIHFNMMFDDNSEINIDEYLDEIKKLELKEKQYAHPLL